MTTTKYCRACDEMRPITEFWHSPTTGKPLSATLEGGSPPSSKAAPREIEPKVLSLGQIIKQKQEMRQAAMRQRGAVKES